MDFALVIIFSRIYFHTHYYIKEQKFLSIPTNNITTNNVTTQNSQLQNSQSTEVDEEETVITNEQPKPKFTKFISHPNQVFLLPLAAIIHLIGSITSTLLVNRAIG